MNEFDLLARDILHPALQFENELIDLSLQDRQNMTIIRTGLSTHTHSAKLT